MPRAPRVCLEPGCPDLTDTGYCTQHRRERDKARGTKAQRGYGPTFQADRKWWAKRVALGIVRCWRPECQKLLAPSHWHLGHDDEDRSVIRGPECPECNLSAAGRASHE